MRLPQKDNKIDIEHLKSLIRNDTILISVCYVDSEVGTIQPIKEIAEIVKQYPSCFLHVDCIQAVGKIPMDLSNVDLISFSPHKFYGLNGFGALIKRKDIVLEPLINGGASSMTHDRKRALSSWRISLSHLVTEEEVKRFLEIFDECYKFLKEEK